MKPRQLNKTRRKFYNKLKRKNRAEAHAFRLEPTEQDDAEHGSRGR